MSEINRNEFFIGNILELIEQSNSEQSDIVLKEYIRDIEFKSTEKNSLYAKCVYDLKKIENLFDIEYRKNAINICEYYLNLSNGNIFNKTKYNNDFRKNHYKQLNVDIPKEKMEKFESILKLNNTTKKAIILEWIDDYIEKNK